jgi:hypothetical protein
MIDLEQVRRRWELARLAGGIVLTIYPQSTRP